MFVPHRGGKRPVVFDENSTEWGPTWPIRDTKNDHVDERGTLTVRNAIHRSRLRETHKRPHRRQIRSVTDSCHGVFVTSLQSEQAKRLVRPGVTSRQLGWYTKWQKSQHKTIPPSPHLRKYDATKRPENFVETRESRSRSPTRKTSKNREPKNKIPLIVVGYSERKSTVGSQGTKTSQES